MTIRVGQLGIGHAHAPGWTKALMESSQVDFVGIHEPDPETFAARSDHPSYAGVRWLSERELLGDPSVQAVFIETHIADNLRWGRLGRRTPQADFNTLGAGIEAGLKTLRAETNIDGAGVAPGTVAAKV
jgi:hypothetical protein